MSKIRDFLFLGSCGDSIDSKFLERNQIKNIVNVTKKAENVYEERINYMRIKVDDQEWEPISISFQRAVQFIKKCKEDGLNVFVHCMEGRSRSATIVLAYLMVEEKMDLLSAYEEVLRCRSCIRPNIGFWEQLVQLEKELTGQESVKPKIYLNEMRLRKRFGVPEYSQLEGANRYMYAIVNDEEGITEDIVQKWPSGHMGKTHLEGAFKTSLSRGDDERRAFALLTTHLVKEKKLDVDDIESMFDTFLNNEFEDTLIDIPKLSEYLNDMMMLLNKYQILSPERIYMFSIINNEEGLTEDIVQKWPYGQAGKTHLERALKISLSKSDYERKAFVKLTAHLVKERKLETDNIETLLYNFLTMEYEDTILDIPELPKYLKAMIMSLNSQKILSQDWIKSNCPSISV